jgi:hypothetical protein
MTNQATNSKSFIIHKDSLSVLKKLTKEEAGELFLAISDYQNEGKLPTNKLISIIFEPFLNQFKRDDEKFLNVCERNKINGSKGGRPKTQNNPVGYLGTQDNPKEPKKADSDSNSNSDSNNDIKNDSNNNNDNINNSITENIITENQPLQKNIEKVEIVKKRFIKPTIDELTAYCNEFALNIDPKHFIDYYESNGWKINKNPMKDWQATARNWNRRNYNKPSGKKQTPMDFVPDFDFIKE